MVVVVVGFCAVGFCGRRVGCFCLFACFALFLGEGSLLSFSVFVGFRSRRCCRGFLWFGRCIVVVVVAFCGCGFFVVAVFFGFCGYGFSWSS